MNDIPAFGLIGHPIDHSGSPRLFKAAYNGRYPYDLIEGEYFESSFKKFLKSYKAINVTAPFKEQAFEKADIVSGPCVLIGAANILIKEEDGIACHNSDFSGVILTVADALFPGLVASCYASFGKDGHKKVHQAVRQSLTDVYGRRPKALIVGCGGAGKAAAVAAAEMGYSVTIANRTYDKAEKFIKGIPEYNMTVITLEELRNAVIEADLIIYTLPRSCDQLAEIKMEDFISRAGGPKIVLEANYRDPVLPAALGEAMENACAMYINGKRWLLFQAVSGYALMTGETPDIAALMAVS